jgi:hypothetical protein
MPIIVTTRELPKATTSHADTELGKRFQDPRWRPQANERPKNAGEEKVCIPLGKISAEQRAEQHQRWFRRGQRLRAGCE